jgi:DNA polymerase III alpha subunit
LVIVLGIKSDYSFMRGFGTAEQWLARAQEIGATAIGIADYCSTWGHTPFRKTFKGSGIKLIYGVQIPVVHQLDKDPRHSLVTLYAKDNLAPLYELITTANQQSYYRPRLTWDQVAGFDGWVVVDHLLPHHVKRVTDTMFLAREADIEGTTSRYTIPHYGPRYPGPADKQGFELVQAISGNTRIGEVGGDAVHMLRQGEYNSKFGVPDATELMNLVIIADRTTADIPAGTLIPSGVEDKRGQLEAMALRGALNIGLAALDQGDSFPSFINPAYYERLQRELDVIHEKDFEDYFFFVEDLVRWSKGRMFVGPGRGSAGGSLLCYLLGITNVDPLKFGTMFERFIDITRADLPDIDIDFPDNRREEVFAYLKEKYGDNRVARLGTISEFGGKSAINDTARATGVPFDVAREFGRYTEGAGQGVVISPARVFGTSKDDSLLSDVHYALFEKYPQIKMAASIDGHSRHSGVHASGVLVTDRPVTDYGSISKVGVIAMDMKNAEDIGLIKMDALGLKELSVIQTACDLAGVDPYSLYNLNWEDQEVFDAIFNKDRVTGVFQFGGQAVRSLLKGLGRIERFDDICALTSLARPGPLVGGAAEGWVKARRGDIEPRDLHPSLESTFGVICYQEQMMAIARDIAGFNIVDVQGMRRAVAKKDPVKLKAYRGAFVTGAAAHFRKDMPVLQTGEDMTQPDYEGAEERAEALWEELVEFGSYAFNLAHAVEYGMISFMCAWLKLHYPLQFAAATLRYEADPDKSKNILRELKEEGFSYVPFDPKKSRASWSIIDGKLYGGFDSVRGVGSKTAERFVSLRNNDPEGWLEELTESQREKILTPHNTPWHSLTYFGDTYYGLYQSPETFKTPYFKNGVRGPVLRIRNIPEERGSYAFVGRIIRVTRRDANDETRVAKRGSKVKGNDWFINLVIEDDTGEIAGTVNRMKSPDFKWLLEEDLIGRDFFFRANVIEDGRRWLFFDKIKEMKDDKSE